MKKNKFLPFLTALKESIKKKENSYVINFRSDEWTAALNREVVNW